jgi:hypothetical protein
LEGISGGVVGLAGGGDADSDSEGDEGEDVDFKELLGRKGTQISSLFGTTVGGVAGSVKGITGGIGNLTSALTDDKYQQERMERQEREAKRRTSGSAAGNLGRGLFGGLKNVGRGVFDGVTGIIEKPLEGVRHGAQEGGAGGALLGLGKGLFGGVTGLVSKSVIGVADGANSIIGGVQGTVESGTGVANPVREHKQIRPRKTMSALTEASM